MRKPIQQGLLASLLSLTAGCIWALDLSQAYQLALEGDATLKAARAAAQAGREQLPIARSQLLPNVSAGLSRYQNKLSSQQPNFLGALSESKYDYPSGNTALVLRQPLYRPYLSAQLTQAEAQVRDAEAMLALAEQELPVRLGGAYFDALLAQDQVALALSQVKTYQGQLDAAQKMLAGGSGIRTDVDEARARLDMSRAQLLEAQQYLDQTRQQLEVVLSQPAGVLAVLAPSKLVLSAPVPANVVAWIEKALANNNEIKVLSARVEASAMDIDKARSGHRPTLDAVAQWRLSRSENQNAVQSRYDQRSIGIELNIPLYRGGGVDASVRQALAQKEQAEQRLEAARRDLGVRVLKEYRGVTEGVQKIQALEQAVRSAEQAVLSSEKSFKAGSRTRVDILNAQQRLMIAQRDLAQARYMYLMAKLRLKALGSEADAQGIAELNQALVAAKP